MCLGRPTPLISAVLTNEVEIVELLLDYGASPDLEVRHYSSPLSSACYHGNLRIAELLIERGADVDGGARYGRPIEKASWYGRENVVAMLLACGANPQPVIDRGIASVFLIPPAIIRRLIDAGAVAPPEILKMLKGSKP